AALTKSGCGATVETPNYYKYKAESGTSDNAPELETPHGRQAAVHEILDERIEDDAERAGEDSGEVRLPARCQVAHRTGNRLADRVRGSDAARRVGERQGRVDAHALSGHDEGSRRRVREAERGVDREVESITGRPLDRHDRVLRGRAAGVRHGVEPSLRHRAPPRADHDVLAADGFHGARDLRAERGRAVGRPCRLGMLV